MGVPTSRWQILLLGAWALLWELAGRLCFPNWDVSYALYGSRFVIERGGPWMNVWQGMDLLLGNLGKVLHSPEAAITLVGLVLNLAATLAVWAIAKRQGVDRWIGICAALATGMWFKPPVGGWIGDHLSFAVGLAPALALAMNGGRWSRWLAVLSGACLAYGFTLKLNNYGPALMISTVWMGLMLAWNHGVRWGAIARGAAWLAAGALPVALLLAGLYANVLSTYAAVLQSQANTQASWQRLLLLPLQIDLVSAVRQGQGGVLIFVPLAVGFWLALARSGWKLCHEKDQQARWRHATAVLMLVSSALVGLSLGRGLTHRLFLLPAGLLLSSADLAIALRWRRLLAGILLGYLLAAWLSFAWVQRGLERNTLYNSRQLLGNNQPTSLCLGTAKPADERSLVLRAEMLPGIDPKQARCWSRDEVRQQFAGLVDVQELANALGIAFRNQEIGAGDFREKWNWRQALPQERERWVVEQSKEIEKLNQAYLVERLPLIRAELEIPGYAAWQQPRLQQRQALAAATGSEAIGKLGSVTIWRTRWQQPMPPTPAKKKTSNRAQ